VIEIVLEGGHTVIVKFNSGDLDDSLAVCQMKDDVSLVQYLLRTCLRDLVPEIYAVDYTRNAGLQWVMMEKVGGVMVMDAYRAWRRVGSDEAKLRMVSANDHNTVRSCIHDIFDVTNEVSCNSRTRVCVC